MTKLNPVPRLPRGATADQRAIFKRQRVERRIVHNLIDELIEGGYELRLYDGEEWATPRTRDRNLVKNACFSVDEETLWAYQPQGGPAVGTVFLVYGNDGHDVICDHSVSLDDHITETIKLADKLAEE